MIEMLEEVHLWDDWNARRESSYVTEIQEILLVKYKRKIRQEEDCPAILR